MKSKKKIVSLFDDKGENPVTSIAPKCSLKNFEAFMFTCDNANFLQV